MLIVQLIKTDVDKRAFLCVVEEEDRKEASEELLCVLDTDVRTDGSDLDGNGSSSGRSVRHMLAVAVVMGRRVPSVFSVAAVVDVAAAVVHLGLVVVRVVRLVGLVLAVPVVSIGSQQVSVLSAVMSSVLGRVTVPVFAVRIMRCVSC